MQRIAIWGKERAAGEPLGGGHSVGGGRFSPLATGRPNLPCARRPAAFTLIELLVVVAIIGTLAALTISTLGYLNRKGAESRARSEIAAISSAIESFKIEFGSYPTSNSLFGELTGAGPLNTNRVLFEPLSTNTQFLDPWGEPYGYATSENYFELWSTAGGTSSNNWIRN